MIADSSILPLLGSATPLFETQQATPCGLNTIVSLIGDASRAVKKYFSDGCMMGGGMERGRPGGGGGGGAPPPRIT